jgi:hypothetical protein
VQFQLIRLAHVSVVRPVAHCKAENKPSNLTARHAASRGPVWSIFKSTPNLD